MNVPRLWLVAVLIAFVAGCGGGGGGGGGSVAPPVTTTTPPSQATTPPSQASPTPTPTATGSTGTITAPLSAQGASASIPGNGGYGGQMTFPAPQGTTAASAVVVGSGTSAPSGVPTLQSMRRVPQAKLGITALAYVSFTSSGGSVTFPQLPTITLTLPAAADPTQNYFLAFYDASNASVGYVPYVEGPAIKNGASLQFPAPTNGIAFTLKPGANSALALFAQPVSGPAASPTPSPSPTPTATPAITPYPSPANGLSTTVPAQAGKTATYAGTIARTTTNYFFTPGPFQTSDPTTTVAYTVTTAGSGGNFTQTTSETDVAPLRTTTSTGSATLRYEQSGNNTLVRVRSTSVTDSNGVTYATNYGPNNGVVAVLPYASSTAPFGNDAQQVYRETDPGVGSGVTTTRNVASDGSYTQYSLTTGNVANIATELGNGTGVYALNAVGIEYDFATPATDASSGLMYVPITVFSFGPGGVKSQSGGVRQAGLWYPGGATPVFVNETENVTTGLNTVDANCAATVGAPPYTKIVQTVVTTDIVLGTIETATTTTYDGGASGTVCAIAADTLDVWYDYTGQNGTIVQKRPALGQTNPWERVTVTQTLGLTGLKTASAGARAVQSGGPGPHLVPAAMRAHVARLAHAALREIRR